MRIFNKSPKPRTLYPRESLRVRVNKYCIRHMGWLLLLVTILLLALFLLVSFTIIGASVESGNYYNHIGDCL